MLVVGGVNWRRRLGEIDETLVVKPSVPAMDTALTVICDCDVIMAVDTASQP